jgi:hypothetical protein
MPLRPFLAGLTPWGSRGRDSWVLLPAVSSSAKQQEAGTESHQKGSIGRGLGHGTGRDADSVVPRGIAPAFELNVGNTRGINGVGDLKVARFSRPVFDRERPGGDTQVADIDRGTGSAKIQN